MVQPTSYLSPEECAMGEGLRILSDDRFYWPPGPEPLPVEQLFEIDQALQRRIRGKRMARRLLYVLWIALLIRSTIRGNPREVYAIRLWCYICGNATTHTEPRMPFSWFQEAYDMRQAIFKGKL